MAVAEHLDNLLLLACVLLTGYSYCLHKVACENAELCAAVLRAAVFCATRRYTQLLRTDYRLAVIIDYNASVGVTAPVSARLFANNLVTTYQHEHLVNIIPDTIKMLAQAVARCPGFQPPLRHARGATTVRYQVGCVDTCLAVYLKRHVHAIRATFAQDCPDLDV